MNHIVCGSCKTELKGFNDECPVCKEKENKKKELATRPDYDLIFPDEKERRERKENRK